MTKPSKHIPATGQSQNNGRGHSHQIIQATQTTYSGPIPPAEELARYEAVSPGLAMELVNMAKKEQDARLENNGILVKTQTDAIKEEISLKKRGQWFAVGSVCVIVGLCAYAFYLGHAAAAATIATGVIVGLAGVFIYSKYQEKKDPNS